MIIFDNNGNEIYRIDKHSGKMLFQNIYLKDANAYVTRDINGNLVFKDINNSEKTLSQLASEGGSVAWGAITGTLSSQTDLQGALDNKSATTHNHNLNNLAEKSYNSLTDKPTISGSNTGDDATNSQYSGLATSKENVGIAAGLITTHAGESDPHTGYQKESEKAQANGYASLGAGGLVPIVQMASGTPNGTRYIRDDGTLQTPAAAMPDILEMISQVVLVANTTVTTTKTMLIPETLEIPSTYWLEIPATSRVMFI